MQTALEDISGPQPHTGHRIEPEDEDNVAFLAALDSLLCGETPVTPHYQPIVDLRRGIVAGYEALARLPAALGSAPDICFAAAALVGKRRELEQVVSLTTLLSKNLLPHNCFLSVNVSPTFLTSPHWQAVLASVPDLSGVVIEVTEEESIADYEVIREKLAQVRSLGGSVAVDDAGSGYASMQHVLEIKPSFIKIDRNFIKNCNLDRAKAVMIDMMGRVADRLDAWVIAEGIEAEPELAELLQLGVPLGQGYFLGRPHPLMQRIPPERTAWIQARIQKLTSPDRLAAHTEPCPSRPSAEAALQHLSTLKAGVVAVTDIWNRPLEVFEQHPLLGRRSLPTLMKIQTFSDPVEVLHRALVRPAACRFDSFVVVDSKGALQGVVHMDRLMRALLESTPSTNDSMS